MNDYDPFSIDFHRHIGLKPASWEIIDKGVFRKKEAERAKREQEEKEKREQKEREEKERRERYESYWAVHAEERKQLEAEEDALQTKLNELQKQLAPFDSEILQIKKQRKGSVPSEKEKESTESEISSLRSQQSRLGIFKSKEKKALKSQIDELNARLSIISASIETERKELHQKCDERIDEIEGKIKPIKEQIADIQNRIGEIKKELTKER